MGLYRKPNIIHVNWLQVLFEFSAFFLWTPSVENVKKLVKYLTKLFSFSCVSLCLAKVISQGFEAIYHSRA